MRRIAALVLSAGLSLAAGQALACPYPDHHHRHGEGAAYGERHESYEDRRESYRYEDEGYAEDGYAEDRYGPRRYDDAPPPPPPPPRRYGASAWYMDGRHPPCDCAPAGGAVQVSDSFFDDAGGVGPIPGGDWYGGGGYYLVGDSYGHASARSYASASSSASASVSIRGGARYGGYSKGGYGKGGHKGGCSSCKSGGKH